MRKLHLARAFAVSSILLSGAAFANEDRSDVLTNIEPIGKIRIQGLSIPAAGSAPVAGPAVAEAASGDAAAAPVVDGKKTYETVCFACHAAGPVSQSMGSPAFGDAAAWAPRIAAGMDSLYNSALNGKNGMPPRGGNASLTDEQVKATVDYMVSQSQ